MKRSLVPMFAVLAMLALGASAVSGCGTSPGTGTQPPIQALTSHYAVTLSPLNGSRVSGAVQLDLTGNVLVVTIHVTGLEPNRTHYQHIHGNAGGTVACPTSADADANGLISVETGVALVGPIALDLQPYAQVTGPEPIEWSHTYTLGAGDLENLSPLTGHVVVLHGMTYHGKYDRALFVACGPIRAA